MQYRLLVTVLFDSLDGFLLRLHIFNHWSCRTAPVLHAKQNFVNIRLLANSFLWVLKPFLSRLRRDFRLVVLFGLAECAA